ncbi:CBS domain-containing protein [Nocardioides panacis]|uniref:CBS domain-containing protein n=1 Tax=Nocardioides panacis TaxID=2849501 RepID=A0A975SZP5_9ACTN|nr:CBS domain-containing protein [Nocardioides panacis]QWZ08861.1 CBS domain-containing protein [Nocardioides panacis]
MLVREVMTQWPITVHPETSTREALRRLDEHTITAMPVVRPDGRIVGVVSEADLVRDAVAGDPRGHLDISREPAQPSRPGTVGEVMNHHPVTVGPQLDVAEAVELMTSTSVKSVPVVDDGLHVLGMLSRRDVVHVLARADERLEREIDDLYRAVGMDWTVAVQDGVVTVDGPVGDRARALAETLAATVPGVSGVRVTQPF